MERIYCPDKARRVVTLLLNRYEVNDIYEALGWCRRNMEMSSGADLLYSLMDNTKVYFRELDNDDTIPVPPEDLNELVPEVPDEMEEDYYGDDDDDEWRNRLTN